MTSVRKTTGSMAICWPAVMAGEIDGTGVLGVALSPCLATGIEGDEEPGKLKRRECSPLVVVTPLMLEFGTACETAEMLCDDETLANCDELILLSDEIGGTMERLARAK